MYRRKVSDVLVEMGLVHLRRFPHVQQTNSGTEYILNPREQKLLIVLDDQSIQSHLYATRGPACVDMFPILAELASERVIVTHQRPHLAKVHKPNHTASHYYYFENNSWRLGVRGSSFGRIYDALTEEIYVARPQLNIVECLNKP